MKESGGTAGPGGTTIGEVGVGKVAVVTGAGSGLGRALAIGLARRGCRLALCDVDAPGLQVSAVRARAHGAEVVTERVDVADRTAVAEFASTVAGHFGVVHQLYNNAGIASGRRLLDLSYADLDRVLAVNLGGVLTCTKELLPHLVRSGDGHLITISSLNGFLAQPGLAAYCTSKFAVRGFTETVRAEMLADRLPVAVSVVMPGGVRTNIATAMLDRARAEGLPVREADERRVALYNEKLLTMDPTDAAEAILRGVAARRPRILIGRGTGTLDALTRLLPSSGARVTAWTDRRFGGA